jgi:hypothetical protein
MFIVMHPPSDMYDNDSAMELREKYEIDV